MVTLTRSAAAPPPTPSGTVEGFGALVSGGEDYAEVHVTNLNNSGAGSLREALSAGNRRIVFDVAGTITFTSAMDVSFKSNLTIDGSTAPSPGITIGATGSVKTWPLLFIGCTNFIIRQIRFRDADRPGTGDNLTIKDGSTNFVVDHCSLEGGTDGLLDITTDCHDGTVQWCILGPEGGGTVTLIAYNTQRVSYHHNLLYEGGSRQPQIGSSAQAETSGQINGDVRCNLVWGPVGDIYGTAASGAGQKANSVRNYYYLAPGRSGVGYANHSELGAGIFASGCFDKRGGSTQPADPIAEVAVVAPFQITMEATATLAATAVLADAGCRVGGLDASDAAKIDAINAEGL